MWYRRMTLMFFLMAAMPLHAAAFAWYFVGTIGTEPVQVSLVEMTASQLGQPATKEQQRRVTGYIISDVTGRETDLHGTMTPDRQFRLTAQAIPVNGTAQPNQAVAIWSLGGGPRIGFACEDQRDACVEVGAFIGQISQSWQTLIGTWTTTGSDETVPVTLRRVARWQSGEKRVSKNAVSRGYFPVFTKNPVMERYFTPRFQRDIRDNRGISDSCQSEVEAEYPEYCRCDNGDCFFYQTDRKIAYYADNVISLFTTISSREAGFKATDVWLDTMNLRFEAEGVTAIGLEDMFTAPRGLAVVRDLCQTALQELENDPTRALRQVEDLDTFMFTPYGLIFSFLDGKQSKSVTVPFEALADVLNYDHPAIKAIFNNRTLQQGTSHAQP